jgi:hypothetical protein
MSRVRVRRHKFPANLAETDAGVILGGLLELLLV